MSLEPLADADPTALPAAGPGAWTLWTVLRRPTAGGTGSGPALADVVGDLADPATADGDGGGEAPHRAVTLRGMYDVSGLRAGADLMLWLHGDRPEDLQAEVRRLRRSAELAPLAPVWSAMGVHRPAEFSADHLPAYMRDTTPREWLTVYPFVRSYEWYLLPPEERRAMLGEHGRKGRVYGSVLSNTVASFGLGDYEWLLGLEADDLTDLVDLMRDLRDTQARLHVREEVPFFAGRRVDVDEVAAVVL